jgi:hypothetical protein
MTEKPPQYRVNQAQSKRLAARLQSYLSANVWDPATRRSWSDFCCESKTECKGSASRRGATFVAAQGHAVGPCYDLSTADGTPHRVLVVPMEAGGSGKGFVDAEGRTTAVHNPGLTPFKNRNPHMQGLLRPQRSSIRVGRAVSPHPVLEQSQSGLLQRHRQPCDQGSQTTGIETRADRLTHPRGRSVRN